MFIYPEHCRGELDTADWGQECTLHGVQCTLKSAHCILQTAHCILLGLDSAQSVMSEAGVVQRSSGQQWQWPAVPRCELAVAAQSSEGREARRRKKILSIQQITTSRVSHPSDLKSRKTNFYVGIRKFCVTKIW